MIDKILAGIAAIMLCLVLAIIGYNEFSKSYVTVIVSLKDNQDPFVAIQYLVPADSQITKIRQVDRAKNQYMLIVRTRRGDKSIVDWLLKDYRVDSARISDE